MTLSQQSICGYRMLSATICVLLNLPAKAARSHVGIDLAAEPLPEMLLCGFLLKGDKVGEIE